jgi:hypothetical protein
MQQNTRPRIGARVEGSVQMSRVGARVGKRVGERVGARFGKGVKGWWKCKGLMQGPRFGARVKGLVQMSRVGARVKDGVTCHGSGGMACGKTCTHGCWSGFLAGL